MFEITKPRRLIMSTPEQEHHQVALTQNEIRQVKIEVGEIAKQVSEVHQALIGNALAKDGGLVRRVEECETAVLELNQKIDDLTREADKKEIYIRWLWALATGFITTVFSLLITNYFYHTPPAQTTVTPLKTK